MNRLLRLLATGALTIVIVVTFLYAIVPMLILMTALTLYNRVVEPLA